MYHTRAHPHPPQTFSSLSPVTTHIYHDVTIDHHTLHNVACVHTISSCARVFQPPFTPAAIGTGTDRESEVAHARRGSPNLSTCDFSSLAETRQPSVDEQEMFLASYPARPLALGLLKTGGTHAGPWPLWWKRNTRRQIQSERMSRARRQGAARSTRNADVSRTLASARGSAPRRMKRQRRTPTSRHPHAHAGMLNSTLCPLGWRGGVAIKM